MNPEIKAEVETSGGIITTVHDIINTNNIILNFNKWAIPFLLYYGKEVGGTRFNKVVALTLRGNYTKRIYKMISRWRDKESFSYSLKELKKDFNLPDSYDGYRIKTRILEPASKSIKESNSNVWFEFKMFAKKKDTGRKPKIDTIVFYIKNKEGRRYQKISI